MMNIRSAQQMMGNQTLEYVFPFSGSEFQTDVNFVVTTGGRQSTFFQVTISMRFFLNIAFTAILDGRQHSP
jgi:hypothetical protein